MALEKAKIEVPPITKNDIIFSLNKLKDGDVEDPAYRRKIIATFINAVHVFDDGDGGHRISISCNLNKNNQPVTLDQILKVQRNDLNGIPKKCLLNQCLAGIFCCVKRAVFLAVLFVAPFYQRSHRPPSPTVRMFITMG